MTDKAFASVPEEKRGGYSGSKPGEQMRPPVQVPSGVSQNNDKGDSKK